jgi:hypothetical protein
MRWTSIDRNRDGRWTTNRDGLSTPRTRGLLRVAERSTSPRSGAGSGGAGVYHANAVCIHIDARGYVAAGAREEPAVERGAADGGAAVFECGATPPLSVRARSESRSVAERLKLRTAGGSAAREGALHLGTPASAGWPGGVPPPRAGGKAAQRPGGEDAAGPAPRRRRSTRKRGSTLRVAPLSDSRAIQMRRRCLRTPKPNRNAAGGTPALH